MPPEQQDESVESNGLHIPPWAMWVIGSAGVGVLAIVIPWGAWVTFTLIQVQYTAMSPADGRSLVSGVESRLDRIDQKLENLQRDFDRSVGRVTKSP